MAFVENGIAGGLQTTTFDRAVERFTKSLTDKQKEAFQKCSIQDVCDSIDAIQNEHSSRNKMRNMARIQAFLEGMDEYRKVVEAFLNCTPFMGYVWATSTCVTSLDVILNAYKQIRERMPAFIQYQALFDKNPEMRRALELYYCDILDFHYHAVGFLNRPRWKKLFDSFWKRFETRFRCILDSLGRHKELIESEKTTLTLIEVERMQERMESHIKDMDDMEKKKQLSVVQERLEASDYQADHYTISEQRRQNQSGNWILQNELFREWSDADLKHPSVLYINGIPGAGKSTLASYIIEVLLEDPRKPTLFFYCKYNTPTKTTLKNILRALLIQLACKDSTVASYIFEECCRRDQVGISAALEQLAKDVFDTQAMLFIVLDGLDECEPEEVQKTLSWFLERQKSTDNNDHGHIRLLCVSQRTEVIQRMLPKAPQISLENQNHERDILEFVMQQASLIEDEFGVGSEVQAQIATRVANAAKSMFLFAKLVMQNLQNQISRHDLMQELEPEVFPVDLGAAYERVVASVYRKGRPGEAAVRIINWIACARRPFTWGEIQATFFIDPDKGTADFQDRKLVKSCKKLCGSLIDMSKSNCEPEADIIVTLVHETAREYLRQNGLINLSLQHARMALWCLDYLSSPPFLIATTEIELRHFSTEGYYAFLGYAASYWLDHFLAGIDRALQCNESSELYQRLDSQMIAFLRIAHILDQKDLELVTQDHSRLHYIVSRLSREPTARNKWVRLEARITHIMEVVEKMAQDPQGDSEDASNNLVPTIYGNLKYRCPKLGCTYFQEGFTSSSSRDAHLDHHQRRFRCTVPHCPYQTWGFPDSKGLDRHISRSHKSGDESTQFLFPKPLKGRKNDIEEAIILGDAETVQTFIARGQQLGGLVNLSIQHGRLDICKVLIGHGAPLDLQAVHDAVRSNDLELMRIFVSSNTLWSHRPQRFYGLQALRLATQMTHAEICKFLIDDSPYTMTFDALLSAVKYNDLDIVRCLLHLDQWKAETSKSIMKMWLPTAVANDFKDSVRMLLDRGYIAPDAKDGQGQRSLSVAVDMQNLDVVRMLLATGKFDPDAKDNQGQTLLFRAVKMMNLDIVSMLLTTGKCNPDLKSKGGQTPLWLAIKMPNLDIVRKLLTIGKCDPDAKNTRGQTPLFFACRRMDLDLVKLLLETGTVDVNAKFQNGETPLAAAVTSNSCPLASILLSAREIDVNGRNESGDFPLLIAVRRGAVAMVNILLEATSVDPDARASDGKTPLIIASETGNYAIAGMLLETYKVNVNAFDDRHRSPIRLAIEGDHPEVVRLLMRQPHFDVHLPGKTQITALQLAMKLEKDDIMDTMMKSGRVDVNVADRRGRTPLMLALEISQQSFIEMLVETPGVNLNATDAWGETALDYAVASGRTELLNLLLELGAKHGQRRAEIKR